MALQRDPSRPSKTDAGSRSVEAENARGRASGQAMRWYELVRTLRTYYDHLRIAFPQLQKVPRAYSDAWADEFRAAARKFVALEDMHALREVLVGVGYASEKWDRVVACPTEEVALAIDRLLAGNGPTSHAEGDEDATGTDGAGAQQVVEALGEKRWQALLAHPESVVDALDRHLETGEAVEEARSYQFIVNRNGELEEELETIRRRHEESREENRELLAGIGEKDEEIQRLQGELRKAGASARGTTEKAETPRQKPESPSAMADRLKEQEQALRANEERIAALRSQAERDTKVIGELEEDLQRERELRRRFEEEMDTERQQLREQAKRLGSLLSEGAEIPALEEFEEMTAEELLDYIEDVEQDKQRVLAGLDALDAQEESYKKQLGAQQEELETIQEDLEQQRASSSLAAETEDLRGTVSKQRGQLQTLLGYSRDLKLQNDQLTKRQEPLRGLVERLNGQKGALVRYVRLNYDRGFMPQAVLDED